MFTPADVDANVRVICVMNEPRVGVALCRLPCKKVDFSLSDITAQLQVPLSTLISSVILHDYVELSRKV